MDIPHASKSYPDPQGQILELLLEPIQTNNAAMIRQIAEFAVSLGVNQEDMAGLIQAAGVIGFPYKELTVQQLNEKFLEASKIGNVLALQWLFEAGADINTQDDFEWTPLMYSIREGNTAAVNFLIKKGANIHLKNNNDSTALILTALHGYMAILELLIEKGADIYSINKDNSSALRLAYYFKRTTIVYRLLCAMLPEKIESEIKAYPFLQETVNNFDQAILENRKKLFSLVSPCLIKDDTNSFFEGQEFKMISSQLSLCFPEWYTHKIENELRMVFQLCNTIKQNWKVEKSVLELKEPILFSQLLFANKEERSEIIKSLGAKYSFENCVTHLGYINALQIYSENKTTSMISSFCSILNQASHFLPCFRRNNTDVEMKQDSASLKRNRPENELDLELEENEPSKKRRKIGSSSGQND